MRFESRMSDADALMWTIEKDPLLRSTILAVSLLDRPPERDRLVERLERGSREIPRMRQRVVGNPWSLAPPRWEVDPNFDLHYHLRSMRVPGKGTLRDLLDACAPLAMQGFDRARPLWEFWVVDGLDGDRAALVQKVHHTITDGVGGVKMAMVLLDLERDPSSDPSPLPPEPEGQVLGPWQRLLDAAAHEARRQAGVARRAVASAPAAAAASVTNPVAAARSAAEVARSVGRMLAPVTEPLSPVMRKRSLRLHLDTLSVPLPELKAAARKVDGKLNDAFVAAVTGGLRRYHEAHGAPVESLRMTMPINIRDAGSEALAGNRFVPARFAVPVGIADPLERMAVTRDVLRRQRAEPALALTDALAGILFRLPRSVATGVFGAMLKGIDVVTSNVPGAPVPIYLAGARVTSQFAFGPPSGSALNVTLLSHLDDCAIGVTSDAAAVPDPHCLVTCLEEGFDEVRKAR
jgi:diacylglycerol O-acyltransferase / wax synthase